MAGIKEHLRDFRERYLGSPHKDPEKLTRIQGEILAAGIDLHSAGIEWWRVEEVENKLNEKRKASDVEAARTGEILAHVSLLQAEGLVKARWESIEHERQFQVSSEGRRLRSKIDIRQGVRGSSPVQAPIPESS